MYQSKIEPKRCDSINSMYQTQTFNVNTIVTVETITDGDVEDEGMMFGN